MDPCPERFGSSISCPRLEITDLLGTAVLESLQYHLVLVRLVKVTEFNNFQNDSMSHRKLPKATGLGAPDRCYVLILGTMTHQRRVALVSENS